jgi:hypothetical protein
MLIQLSLRSCHRCWGVLGCVWNVWGCFGSLFWVSMLIDVSPNATPQGQVQINKQCSFFIPHLLRVGFLLLLPRRYFPTRATTPPHPHTPTYIQDNMCTSTKTTCTRTHTHTSMHVHVHKTACTHTCIFRIHGH